MQFFPSVPALILVWSILFPAFANAQLQPKLFAQDSLLEFSLTLDIGALQNDRSIDVDDHHAWLRAADAREDSFTIKVQVEARGGFRRSPTTCEFPPLWMRFSKGDSAGPFVPKRKLKLVTHCADDAFIAREYLVYKAYEKLTPYSLRTQLCRVTYYDLADTLPPETRLAFFIEHVDMLAERSDAREVEPDFLSFEEIDRDQLLLVHLFQYMIGNPDHSADRLKNTYLLQPSDTSLAPIPVPYDFDWAEVVDAPYTELEGFSNFSVFKKRKYKPLCRSWEEYNAAFSRFERFLLALNDIYSASRWLSQNEKRDALRYYRTFFREIRNRKKVEKIFRPGCPEKE